MKSLVKFAALGAVAAASSLIASATTLTSTTSVTDPMALNFAFTGDAATPITGVLSADTFTANYAEYVVYDSNNIYNSQCGGSGCLTFVLELSNVSPGSLNTPTHPSANSVENITVGDGLDGFLGYSLNVGYETPQNYSGVAPSSINETAQGTVDFVFPAPNGAIPQGGNADDLVIETNASSYSPGLFSAIDSSTDTENGYIPAVPTVSSVTPEPNSLLLLGTGLIGAAGLLFMRRRNASSML